ncbi:MAG: MinD/ParA family protein [Sporolactobacillus sp.]
MNRGEDQASALRKRMDNRREQPPAEALTVGIVSGKGGVGKSVFSTNFSIALGRLGKRVLIVDLDVGMGNIEQLLGQTSLYHIDDCLRDRLSLKQAMLHGPEQCLYIPGGSGFEDVLELGEQHLHFFLQQVNEIKANFDYILFDFGAGVSEQLLHFVRAVSRLILVTTPEPPAMADGYSALKLICAKRRDLAPLCVVNQVRHADEGYDTWRRLATTARRFIGVELVSLAALHYDQAVVRSVKEQTPCLIRFPSTRFSADIGRAAQNFLSGQHTLGERHSFSLFSERVLHYFKLSKG